MALRKGHGNGAGVPRIEVLPVDELPDAAPAPAVTLQRTESGKIADSATAKALGARGGAAKAQRMRILGSLGLSDLGEDSDFKKYERAAEDLVKVQLVELAKLAGGAIGPDVASMICTAGRQYAASVFLFDKAKVDGNPTLFHRSSVLGNDSRQNFLAAWEIGIKQAKARAETPAISAYDAFEAALREQNADDEDKSGE